MESKPILYSSNSHTQHWCIPILNIAKLRLFLFYINIISIKWKRSDTSFWQNKGLAKWWCWSHHGVEKIFAMYYLPGTLPQWQNVSIDAYPFYNYSNSIVVTMGKICARSCVFLSLTIEYRIYTLGFRMLFRKRSVQKSIQPACMYCYMCTSVCLWFVIDG